VKTASDIYSPLSGTVTEVNDEVVKNPSLVNTDPYGAGWFYKIQVSNPKEAEALLSPDDYGRMVNQ
jgi:glycine cleavage system H protein